MGDDLIDKAKAEKYKGGFRHDGVNPLPEHPEYYPEFLFPRKLHEKLAGIPGDMLTTIEIMVLRSGAGSPSALSSFMGKELLKGPVLQGMPHLILFSNKKWTFYWRSAACASLFFAALPQKRRLIGSSTRSAL